MDFPLISVVMPSFNHRPYVQAGIDSVLNQTYPNVELLIVDNNSTDGTKEIVSSIRHERVRYFPVCNDAIIAASRNVGIAHSRGEFVAFIDSDDAWHPEKLKDQLPHLANPSVSCVGTLCEPTGNVHYYQDHVSIQGSPYRDYGYSQVCLANPVMTSSLLARKRDILAVGGFDEDPDLRFIEDWDLWIRLARLGAVRVLSRRLLLYRVARSAGRGGAKLKCLKIFKKQRSLGIIDEGLYRSACGNVYVEAGLLCLQSGEPLGVRYMLKGLLHCRGWFNHLRATVSLALFLVPLGPRRRLIELLYRLRTHWTGHRASV